MSRPASMPWSDLLQGDWEAATRVFHPAYRLSADPPTVVRWRELASPGVDWAEVGWETLTGVRLHLGRTGAEWDHEPMVGPCLRWATIPALEYLASQDVELTVWEWISDEPRIGNIVRDSYGREYVLREVSSEALLADLRRHRGESVAYQTTPKMTPNRIEGPDSSWVIVSDVDLPCTLIGSSRSAQRHITSITELESVSLEIGQPNRRRTR